MAKTPITIIACEETYKNLSTFNDIEELNKTVRQYKENFANQLSTNAKKILDQLHRYSAKYIGVSFRTKNHIAESLEISRKTVQRACKVLEDLGIIKQLEMKRKSDMRQTSNAIIIMPIVEDVQQDNPEIKEECPPKKTNSISLKQKINKERSNEPLSADFVSNKVPKEFTQYVQYFYNDAQAIEKLFRVVSIQTRYFYHYSEYDRVSLGLEAFKQMIRNIKLGKKIKNVFGYYFGIIKNLLDQEYLELLEGEQ
ncbi:helix-turn-helix domain-containing protein [Neobacillus sp. 3P2-tot-E-2]|uniref:helix-turn-helix domain-containing protein n=1 Tax=Neobacillus sp. 3P2-tot-E-2 TaxID=3132212 RepID=UPI0039A3BB9F